QAGGLEAEVAAVFLHHHVGSGLGDAEQAVHGGVDAHALVDAVLGIGVGRVQLPAGRLLHQRQVVGGVAVDFIGAEEDERRVRAMGAGEREQGEGAAGIDREVGLRIARRPVVGGLRGGVDDDRDVLAVAAEDGGHGGLVADVGVHVGVG